MNQNGTHKNGKPDIKRVFLGMPSYGPCTGGAARAFWSPTRHSEWEIIHRYKEGSLLAANCNGLWVDALNEVHQGRRLDLYAQLHADVEPQDWWLDIMMQELYERKLDVLAAVVPIKDRHGLTSIALGREDGDTWRPLCRLTMTEVRRLPETFTSDDVGHPILINTGLFVCRFDVDWAKQVHFTINDRIAFDTKLNAYVAQCEPEDWFFARLCHELGLKVGATRKVTLTHRGDAAFSNQHVWGNPFDAAWIDHSPVKSTADGFSLPEIEGWLHPEEGKALTELACGKRVLEIGSYCGLSTVLIAKTAKHVVAIDPHDGRATPKPQDTLAALQRNLSLHGVEKKVDIVLGTTSTVDVEGPFDLVFIDGAHDLESVRLDIAYATDRLASSGLIAFHDYRKNPGDYDGRWDPGVTRAVEELIAAGAELLSTHATLAVVRPPALTPLEV